MRFLSFKMEVLTNETVTMSSKLKNLKILIMIPQKSLEICYLTIVRFLSFKMEVITNETVNNK